MANFLEGLRIEGSSTKVSSPPQTSWKKLATGTISSGSQTGQTSSFTAKDNLMILGNIQGGNGLYYQFNSDTGDTNNYTLRFSTDGTTNTNTSRDDIWCYYDGNDNQKFNVTECSNYNGYEKFAYMKTQSRVSSSSLRNNKSIGKWQGTAQITQVQMGSYANTTGGEFLVLGCDDDESDSGSNFWQPLTTKTLTSSTSDFTTDTFDAKKWLFFILSKEKTGGYVNPKMRFNADTGNNYQSRYTDDTNSPTSNTGGDSSRIYLRAGEADGRSFTYGYIYNNPTKVKQVITDSMNGGSEGAGTNPTIHQAMGTWENTSDSITSINMTETASGSFASGTVLQVWGGE
jgi:hypothetical protein